MARKKLETPEVTEQLETPETAIVNEVVNHTDTDIVVKNDTVIVFQAKYPLSESNYELLEKWVRNENEKTGLKIVLAPYSVEVKVGE